MVHIARTTLTVGAYNLVAIYESKETFSDKMNYLLALTDKIYELILIAFSIFSSSR